MKLFTPLLAVALCAVLSSCGKSSSQPSAPAAPTPPSPPAPVGDTGTMKISLALPWTIGQTSAELIVAETGGKALLDTVVSQSSTITTTLSTNATLADVSVVTYNGSSGKYKAITFKAVNPRNWTTAAEYEFSNWSLPAIQPVSATITYVNIPFSPIAPWFVSNNMQLGGGGSAVGTTLTQNYNWITGTPVYALFPGHQLYYVYTPAGTNDTVDCSMLTPDSAIQLLFTTSVNFLYKFTQVIAVPDSTNLSTALPIYQSFVAPDPGAVIPRIHKFQKYQVVSDFTNSTDSMEHYEMSNLGTSVNTTINYPPTGAYVVNSNQPANFSVSFKNFKPSTCLTVFTNGTFNWHLWTSPDSVSINPGAYLTALRSKVLATQSLSGFSALNFIYILVPGFGYADYLNFGMNSQQSSKVQLPSILTCQKGF
jgi:hypothetical protein